MRGATKSSIKSAESFPETRSFERNRTSISADFPMRFISSISCRIDVLFPIILNTVNSEQEMISLFPVLYIF